MKAGDRVKMTPKALERGINTGNRKYPPTTTGIVIRIKWNGHPVILRDNRKAADSYHPSFWMEGDDWKDPIAVELGRRGGLKGGKARAEKMTPEQRSEAARKAANARWNKEV